ncbi:T9SS type A sorting domain-containing protein [bacterium]|nr:T9SS type A sorting domain-containing protein [bacterium]
MAYDTSALPSGVYVARLSTNVGTLTRRLVITR